jgi:DNA polymerase
MFKASDLVWIDYEVFGGPLDLKAAGAFRYVAEPSTRAIVLAYAIGDAPALTWHADGAILDWDGAPDDLRAGVACGAILAAWNASFDSAVWNYATLGFPFLDVERVIDPMVQAGVSNLPTDLEHASRYLGGTGKQKDGRRLIKLFCIEGADPRQYPEEWQRFLAYARQDVEAMRDVYRKTRPLPPEEWRQYWAFEHINRRGVVVDLPYVRGAAALAAEDGKASGYRLAELTDKAATRVTQARRIATWLHDNLVDAAMREILTVGVPAEDDVDDDEVEFSLTRDRVARVLAMLDAKHANGGLSLVETKAREVAAIRLYGAGSSPKKFARLDAQQVDGVLRGQYRFAGAGQTGRMSSQGAQIQNLTRDVLGEDGAAEAPLLEAIKNGCNYAALIAASPADRDPTRPDLYTIAAAGIVHKDTRTITKPERHLGKIASLSLIFGGSVGALMAMALNYRVHLDPAEARRIVDAWREANPWAREFWGAHRDGESFGLWGAAMRAWETPSLITEAGRLAFIFRDDYLGGTLFMALPSGRLLTYPRPRWREIDVLDKDGKPTGEKRNEMSFRRAHGRAKLWHGTLCENAVQATAADVLRETVTRIETNPALAWMPIRMTCHDEIVCEVDVARAEEAKTILRREMLILPKWADGLPLQSEESVSKRYTKSKLKG